MTEKEYFHIMWDEKPASRRNDIKRMVNNKVSKENAELKDEAEEMYYDRLMKEAKEHVEEFGFWPEFEMSESDWDDPILDIYND